MLRTAGGRLAKLVAAAGDGEPPHPLPAIAGWMLRLDTDAVLDHPMLHGVLIAAVEAHAVVSGTSSDPGAGSIQRVLAQRSARILEVEGVVRRDGGRWSDAVSTVVRPDSLGRYLRRIMEEPALVLARCPY